MACPEVKLLCDAEAEAWMAEPDNEAAWRALETQCPWATPFQSFTFARSWLAAYRESWQAVLVFSLDVHGKLQALIPLAMQGNEITGLGAGQAEYQGCLCNPMQLASFLDQVLSILFEHYAGAHLKLRYLDFGRYSAEVQDALAKQANVLVREYSRPLITLDEEAISASLRKKSNKSKWNRLKRLGELEFVVTEGEELADVPLDDIIHLYDFRQGAINGVCPFMEDSRKLPFHRDWMKNAPGQLILFRLTLDGSTIGAMLGVLSNEALSNAIVAHSPELASHSPGKFVVYLAAQEMSRRGYKWLDLTPGGDPWKERFADTHDSVLELESWRSAAKVSRQRIRERLAASGKKALQYLQIEPSQARQAWHGVTGSMRRVQQDTPGDESFPVGDVAYRIYSASQSVFTTGPEAAPSMSMSLRKNCLADLLMFDDRGSLRKRSAFLGSALKRLERGHSCYTVCENGKLLFSGWVAKGLTEFVSGDTKMRYAYAQPGSELYGFYTHPSARGRGIFQRALAEIITGHLEPGSDTGAERGAEAEVFYLAAAADNAPVHHVMEKMNFEYCGTSQANAKPPGEGGS